MLRTFLLIVLMTIVPVRGAIGASMMVCGPGHDDRAAATTIARTLMPGGSRSAAPRAHDHASAAAAHDRGAAPHPGAHHDHDGAPPAQDHQDGDPTAHAANTGAHTCSLCAECCGGGAMLLPSALSVPAIAQRDGLFRPIFIHFERRPPDGLERPPHTPLV